MLWDSGVPTSPSSSRLGVNSELITQGSEVAEREETGWDKTFAYLRLRRGFKFEKEGGKSHQLTGLWHLPN